MPPSNVCWFKNPSTIDLSPTKTIVIVLINQLSYRTGAPPCKVVLWFSMFNRFLGRHGSPLLPRGPPPSTPPPPAPPAPPSAPAPGAPATKSSPPAPLAPPIEVQVAGGNVESPGGFWMVNVWKIRRTYEKYVGKLERNGKITGKR